MTVPRRQFLYRFGIVAGMGLVLAACGRVDDGSNPGIRRLDPAGGVLLPADKQSSLLAPCSRIHPSDLTGHWIPGRDKIDRLEQRLPAVLERTLARVVLEERETRPVVTSYRRQYGAFLRAGRRVIYVNAFIPFPSQDVEPWTQQAMGFCDGGLAGFGVVYHVDADRFDPIEFDGRFSGPVRTRWF